MKSFDEIYREECEEIIEEIENARNKMKKNNMNAVGIIISISIFLAILLKDPNFIALIILLDWSISGVYMINSSSLYKVKYKKIYKEKIIPKFVKLYNPTLEYFPNKGITHTAYKNAYFEPYDVFKSSDLITGSIKGTTKFNMAIVDVAEERNSGNGTYYASIFKGLFSELNLENVIHTSIHIRENNKYEENYNEDRVKMDYEEFERNFSVYSKNKIIAMQLLTADIMQLFIDFKEKINIIPEITLYYTKLYIRFRTTSSFEPNVNNEVDVENVKKDYYLINFSLDLIEKLVKNINEIQT